MKLLILNIGPVQEFIASARRTRDLWAGSHLLSEVARAAGEAILSAGGTLIVPGDSAIKSPTAAISNKLVALVPDDDVARKAVVAARVIDGTAIGKTPHWSSRQRVRKSFMEVPCSE